MITKKIVLSNDETTDKNSILNEGIVWCLKYANSQLEGPNVVPVINSCDYNWNRLDYLVRNSNLECTKCAPSKVLLCTRS